MWPVVQLYFSKMSSQSQFRWQSGYQVLLPRRRWDICSGKLHQLQRKDRHCRVVVVGEWRCCAQEFLWGLCHDFEMAVGSVRSTPSLKIEKELKRFP